MLRKLAARYQRLIDYFVPEAIRHERDASNQARMFLISHTMGPILGSSVPIALYFVDPTPGWDILVLSLSILAFWIFPFLLRRGVNYDQLVVASVLNLNFCIFWSCYFNDGVLSPTLPWVLIIPILSFFYIGANTRLQVSLMSIFAGSFGLFLLLYYSTNPPASDIPTIALIVLGVVSTVAALCYVATMAIYYARIFDAGVELENEVRQRRRATDELRSAVVAADRASLHKAEFLARMSHELRTPLNAVIGYSRLIHEDAMDNDDHRMKEDVDRIHDAAQYLMRLINIVLDLSKIEAGLMQFTVEEIELVDVVQEAAARVRGDMRRQGNTLEIHISAQDSFAETDKQRLLQVISAILDNIPVHAPGAYAEIHLRTAGSFTDDSAYELEIRDNGGGIHPDRLETIFEALADQRDASASKYGGTGLNLTIVHKLARAMGCAISVESTVGKGTSFTIRIPKTWVPAALVVQSRQPKIAA